MHGCARTTPQKCREVWDCSFPRLPEQSGKGAERQRDGPLSPRSESPGHRGKGGAGGFPRVKEEPGVSSRYTVTEGEAPQLASAAPRCSCCGRRVSELCLCAPGWLSPGDAAACPSGRELVFQGQYWPA